MKWQFKWNEGNKYITFSPVKASTFFSTLRRLLNTCFSFLLVTSFSTGPTQNMWFTRPKAKKTKKHLLPLTGTLKQGHTKKTFMISILKLHTEWHSSKQHYFRVWGQIFALWGPKVVPVGNIHLSVCRQESLPPQCAWMHSPNLQTGACFHAWTQPS